MKSKKVKLSIIAALAFVMITTLGAFFGIVASANRYVTLSGTSIFNVSGSSEVWAHAVTTDEDGAEIEDEDDYYYYTMFTFDNSGDAVTYRRNLAYKWFYNTLDEIDGESAEEGGETSDGAEEQGPEENAPVAGLGTGYLKMQIGFEEINFEKFTISFETQQFNMTKDEKTTNYVIFLPAEPVNDVEKVYALITSDKDVAEKDLADLLEDDITEDYVTLDIDNIVIELGENEGAENGQFAVSVYNVDRKGDKIADGNVQTGAFENVGKMYAKYVSSSTKPVIPLTFKATFAEDEDGNLTEGQTRARMALYELNNQSFVLNRDAEGSVTTTSRSINSYETSEGKHYEGGQVNDTQPPVLCLDSGITYVKEGSELSFNYTAVDVLTQSPSTVTGYFMLTEKQLEDGIDADNYNTERLFKTVTADEDVLIYPHANHVIPEYNTHYNVSVTVDGEARNYGTAFSSGIADGEEKNDDFVPTAAIKIYLKLTDTASTGGQSAYVFLDWFVEDEYKLNIGGHDYIAVATDNQGATYNYGGDKDFSGENAKAILDSYQAKVDEAAKNLQAGSDEDFYLPSLETLITDDATSYKDMTYSIYYMVNGTTSSVTNKNASQLSIDLNAAGDYIFTVYATDASSNNMWYIDDDGEKVEFAASDIWTMFDDEDEEGLADKLPWFTFSAAYSEITIEDPGEQSTAYVGTTYTASSFEIKGISTSTEYSLYRFNNDLYYEDNGKTLSYQEFMERKKEIFEGEGRKYFTHIMAQADLDENSEEYEAYNAYEWNPSARSFVPQDADGLYLIKCEVTSTQFPTITAVSEYMGIAASAAPDSIKGEDTWVQDNLASIILLSIAGAAFIGIILLLFVKPKNKGDIDEQFEQEIAKKK